MTEEKIRPTAALYCGILSVLEASLSVKQDFLHQSTLQSEHQHIGSIHFFRNKQAARHL